MITCREMAELLFDFASGQLTAEGREDVQRHMTGCPSCVAYAEGYRLTVWMAGQLPRPPLPPQLARRLEAILREGASGTEAQAEAGPGPPGA